MISFKTFSSGAFFNFADNCPLLNLISKISSPDGVSAKSPCCLLIVKMYKDTIIVNRAICAYFFTINKQQGLFADTPSGEEIFEIKFSNGQLSAKLKNAPLEKVLKEIMR